MLSFVITSGVKPWEIIGITFTRKATYHMREALCNIGLGIPMIKTIDSFCLTLCREYGDHEGNIEILEENDCELRMQHAIRRVEASTSAAAAVTTTSNSGATVITSNNSSPLSASSLVAKFKRSFSASFNTSNTSHNNGNTVTFTAKEQQVIAEFKA